MHKKITLLVFYFAFLFQGQAQDYSFGLKISPDKLKVDFSILVSSLKENHPSLYSFISEVQFDALVNQSLVSLTDSLTESEFHVLVRMFTRVIGCGHTSARPSQDWYKAVSAKESLIPIHVLLKGDKLYVQNVFNNGDESLIGSRVISIDGILVDEILVEMKSIIERDGVGTTMENRNIERLFQTLYTFLYGTNPVYVVEVEFLSGEVLRSFLHGGIAKKYPIQKTIELTDVIEIQGAKFGMFSESKKNAVLDLNSFPSKGYKKFYRKVFKHLSELDSIDLILDLRGNSGGYFPNGTQLLRYLMDENFTMDFSKPQNHTKNSKYLKLNFLSQVTRFMFSTTPDRNKDDSARNYQIRYKPIRKNHFDGKIYVITDGLTFSAGSFVASKLKNGRDAIVVGEETGGGEVGFNAVLNWKLSLPNSGVIVTIPIYHVNQQRKMDDIGRGVMPNIPIHYDLEERKDQLDLEIEQILELLKMN